VILLQVNSQKLVQFLRDANSFVVSSHAAIARSAPHIYLSAVPFASKDSLVFLDFESLCAGVVSVETSGTDHHASRLAMTLTGHEGSVTSSGKTRCRYNALEALGGVGGVIARWGAVKPPLSFQHNILGSL